MSNRTYQPLTIPNLEWKQDTLTQTYGEVIAQPLEPGFGITMGNALRRILLGGLEGSAVTSIIIHGVNNEFSSIEGVNEDAMQVLLNCKQLCIRNETGEPGKMRLSWQQAGPVRAEHIETDEHITVLNPEATIAHVAEGASLEIEFFVESGRGYRPAQWPEGQALQEDDRIYLDASFSPVRNVTFDVQKTRVGEDIDYDYLTLSITTDGAFTPPEALHYAVSVLRTQLEHFLLDPEIPFNEISAKQNGASGKEKQDEGKAVHGVPVDLLLKPIDVLELSVRAHNCLVNAGIHRIIDLVNLSEEEVQKIKNFGKKSFEEVKRTVHELGLSFGMDIKESELQQHTQTEE